MKGFSSICAPGLVAAKPWAPSNLGTAILGDWDPIGANVTLNAGKVTNLVDAKGHNMTDGGVALRRPTWTAAGPGGYPQLDFDGVTMALGTAAFTLVNQPFSFYLVWQQFADSVAGVNDILYSNSGGTAMQIQSNVPRISFFAGASFNINGAVPNNGVFGVSSFDHNGAASEVFNNGTSLGIGNPGANGFDLVTLGGYQAIGLGTSNFLHCSIARVIWTTLLSAGNRTLLTNYLRARYATP